MSSQYSNRYAVKPADKFGAQEWREGECVKCGRKPVQINAKGVCKKCWMGK